MRKVSAFRVFKQTAKDGTKKFRVRFFNPDGTIIKTVNLRAGSRIAAYNEARELTEKGEGLAREADPIAYDYILQTWTKESDYIVGRALRGHELSNAYIVGNRKTFENHGKKYLARMRMSEIDLDFIERMMLSLARAKIWPT